MASSPSSAAHDDLWLAVQNRLRLSLSAPGFETWISPLALTEATEDTLTLATDSVFKRDWVLRHYKQALQEAFSQVVGQADARVAIQVLDPALTPSPPAPAACDPPAPPCAAAPESGGYRPWTPRTHQSHLNPKYTFEQFVAGDNSQFCHAAALAVAENPAQSYNPFFIHGGVGLGKTHLAQAIGHFILRHNPQACVRYVTSEQFTNDMIQAVAKRDWTPFRDRYRKLDVLILDDIQFLAGKERTQQELFHTFNVLHEAGKQMILTSDRPPQYLAELEDRLRSRFAWGLMADIQPPDVETRLAILRRKAERDQLALPDEILAYLADVFPHNVRELEGGLNKIAAYHMLTRTPLTLANARQILGMEPDLSRLSLDAVIEAVATYYRLRPDDIKSASRARDIAHARQVAVYLLRETAETSFAKIGQVLGGRSHTTILYSYDKIVEALDSHPVLSQQLREIRARLKSCAVGGGR